MFFALIECLVSVTQYVLGVVKDRKIESFLFV